MCGIINDTIDYVTSGVKELASHPLQTLGTAMLGPALATGLDMAGLGFGSMISPTGNFSTGAWNDMFNASPGNSGLGLFHTVDDIADKVAPAIAGGYAAGAGAGADLGEALGSTTGDTAAGLGGSAFTTGLEGAGDSTLGGLEGSLGGGATFGVGAGTGTAIGSGVAQGLGAGGLGIAGGDSLGGVVGSTFGSALGGSTAGTGLGPTGAMLPGATGANGAAAAAGGTVPTSGGAISGEGGQAAPGAYANGASAGGPGNFDAAQAAGATNPDAGGSNLSTLYGPSSSAPAQPAAMFNGMNTTGISPALTSPAATGNMDPSTFQTIGDLFKLANSGVNAFQQYRQQSANNNYADSIKNLFAPNSPYAQQMQQTLARQDAAAGRNSQYGTRSTQLAAALAQAQANALGNSNYARAATATPGMNALNGLFANFGSPQGIQSLQRLGQLGSTGFNGLMSLFG